MRLTTLTGTVVVTTGLVLAAGSGQATATATGTGEAAGPAPTVGHQTFSGFLVASGAAGGRRVLATGVLARGAFTGAGRIVERDNKPGDPDTVSRDDLVFRAGTMHLVNRNLSFVIHVDPKTCIARVNIRQRGAVTGGTQRFRDASGTFNGSVRAFGLLPRTSKGTCSQTRPPLLEIDFVAASGTLSY